jgi:hypothetical protein
MAAAATFATSTHAVSASTARTNSAPADASAGRCSAVRVSSDDYHAATARSPSAFDAAPYAAPDATHANGHSAASERSVSAFAVYAAVSVWRNYASACTRAHPS